MSDLKKTICTRKDVWLLAAIVLLGFLLRAAGIGFGLPGLFHADEPIVVNHALAYGSGDFNPHFFKIPPLVSYLLFPLYGLFFAAGKLTGLFADLAAFEQAFYADPTAFYLIARAVFGLFCGTATLYVFFRLIRDHFSVTRAFISTFFLAVCFLHVRQSHYVYTDIPLVLVMTAAFFPILKIAQGSRSTRDHLRAGVLIGLATALKYNGGALIIPYLYASWRQEKREDLARLWIKAGAAAALVFYICNPYALLDADFFWSEIRSEAGVHGGVDWTHHLAHSLAGAMSVPLLVLSLGGIAFSLFDPHRTLKTMTVFCVSYYVVLWRFGQPYARYVLPLLPGMLFFASDSIIQISRGVRFHRKIVAGVLTALIALPTLAHSVLFDRLMMRPDTRTLAKEWVETNIPEESKIALDIHFYMPPLLFSKMQLEEKAAALGPEGAHAEGKERKLEFFKRLGAEKPAYYLYELASDPDRETGRFLFSKPRLPYDLEALKNTGIEYVITSQIREDDFHRDFYRRLEEEAELLKRFNPYRNNRYEYPVTHPLTGGPFSFRDVAARERNGQPLKIYRLN